MKVLAINGSPRGERGNTERILQSFLAGAREAGARTETVYLRDQTIHPCTGCFVCWTKTPGVCIHRDDMSTLLEAVLAADVLVLATPLYIFTVSGLMKDFLDRLIPLAEPYIVERGGHYIHPMRHPDAWPKRLVVISNAGFPQRHHFSGLEETFHRFADTPDIDLVGMILCAGGELLTSPLKDRLSWYLEAARQAGREVVEQGCISPETQEVLDRPLVENPAAYARMANAYWNSVIVRPEERPSPAQGEGAPLSPPTSRRTMRDLVAEMATAFDPEAAGDLEAVIQFEVEDEKPGRYYLHIAGGACGAYEGAYPSPTLTIHTPAAVWLAIAEGHLDGAQAMVEGKYTVEGDLGLLLRFGQLFAGGQGG